MKLLYIQRNPSFHLLKKNKIMYKILYIPTANYVAYYYNKHRYTNGKLYYPNDTPKFCLQVRSWMDKEDIEIPDYVVYSILNKKKYFKRLILGIKNSLELLDIDHLRKYPIEEEFLCSKYITWSEVKNKISLEEFEFIKL